MKWDGRKLFVRLERLWISPGLEPAQQAARIHAVERDIVLPIKWLIILTLCYYFFFSNWLGQPRYLREVAFESIRKWFLIYAAVNMAVGAAILAIRRIPLTPMQWTIYTTGLLDGLLFAALTFVTEGFDSIVFWIFPALILRNAVSVPRAVPQIALNLSVCACYVLAGVMDMTVSHDEALFLSNDTREALSIGPPANPAEPFLMRILILVLWTFCCYGVQALFEKHRRAVEEAVEFASRQEQLQTAGRLAAAIAHRIKNPLGIINNAAFCLERAKDGPPRSLEQVRIIREEVEKADRIVTELMGYAQLAEGRVEILDIAEELDRAINEVFPAGARFEVEVRRDYAPGLPHLMMQRRHLSEILVNILQNAREALGGKGRVDVSAIHGDDYSVIVTVADNGPGVPPDKTERIFESYFSTKEKGTGLGLAIVRHNIEIYGGTVHVESELGNGARFVLKFPVKTVMKFSR